MATSGGLDGLLGDLRGRRQRLLSLVGNAENHEHAVLVAELQALSEQLVVADEELRVQAKELEDNRGRLAALTEDWSRLFETSAAAQVLTDERGVVLRATHGAVQLAQQPALLHVAQPISTWFDVEDRSRIRRLISDRARSEEPSLERVRLRRRDGSTAVVDLTVAPSSTPAMDGPVLRWELTAVEPTLQVVAPLPLSEVPDLAAELTALASRLARLMTMPELLAAMVAEAVRVVPGADHALIVEIHRRGGGRILAATDAAAVTAGQHVLRVPLGLPGFHATQLRIIGSPSWGSEATSLATMLAVHFRVATARVLQRRNLEHALDTRQLIGQAVGVLVERRRVTPEAAFDELALRSQLVNLKLRELARLVVETGQDPEQITGG